MTTASLDNLIQNLTSSFDSLELDQIPQDVIDGVCSSEFTETDFDWESFPANLHEKVEKLTKALQKIQKSPQRKTIWVILGQQGVKVETLQTLLCRLFEVGCKFSSSYHQKLSCLHSIHLYFLMLKEPGALSNGFFHEALFESCFKSIKTCARSLQQKADKPKSKKKQPQQQQSSQQSRLVVMFSDSEDDESENVENISLTQQQKVEIKQLITSIIAQLTQVLQVITFKGFLTDILQHTIEAIVETLECFEETPLCDESFVFPCSQLSVDTLLYKSLYNLVDEKQGAVSVIGKQVMEHVYMTSQRRAYTVTTYTIPRDVITSISNVLKFAHLIRKKYDVMDDVTMHIVHNFVALCRDKTVFRTMMTSQLMKFIERVPQQFYLQFIEWLARFVKNDKNNYVISALYAIEGILTSSHVTTNNDDDVGDGEDGGDETRSLIYAVHVQLFQTVVKYCDDVTITVRCRSFQVLSAIFEKRTLSQKFLSDAMMVFRSNTGGEGEDFNDWSKILLGKLMKRTSEDSSLVRKSSLQALSSAIIYGYIKVDGNKQVLKCIRNACLDPMLSVRKLAIQIITDLLRAHQDDELVCWYWFKCVVTSLIDTESSLEEKAAQLLETIILTPIINGDSNEEFSWKLLSLFTHKKRFKYRCYFEKLITLWHDKGLVTNAVIKKISRKFDDVTMKPICWLMFRMMSVKLGGGSDKIIKKSANDVINRYFIDDFSNCQIESNFLHIYQKDTLCAVGQLAKYVEDKDTIIDYLKKEIESYKFPVTLISIGIETIVNLVESKSITEKESQKLISEWCKRLIQNCDEWICQLLGSNNNNNYQQDTLINRLHVVSSSIQRSPQFATKKLLLSIQALLTDLKQNNTNNQENENGESQKSTQALSQFYPNGVPPIIRSHAIICLGKICLLNEKLAKKCIGAIANEMETSPCAAIRNNSLLIMCDLTTVQTQLTNPYINSMATCLCDSDIFIRKQCVLLISGLIKKEYIKWKGSLLYKFLFAANSGNEQVMKLTKNCLAEILHGDGVAGNFYYQNFIAAVFYFNSYDVKRVTGVDKTEKEKSLFDMCGAGKWKERLNLYKYMISCMEDYNRINLTRKIIDEIIEPFVKTSIPFNHKTSELLKDSLSILCCQEIRLKCLNKKDSSEGMEDIEEMEVPSTQQQKQIQNNKVVDLLKKKFVTQAVKRNLIENIFPYIIELKNMLALRRSPLMKNVMMYLREIMSEYRDEVNSMLSQDEQLAKEVEFEMKRFEREQEEEKENEQQQKQNAEGVNATGASFAQPNLLSSVVLGADGNTPATARRIRRSLNLQTLMNSARKSIGRRSLVGNRQPNNSGMDGSFTQTKSRTKSAPSVVRSIFSESTNNTTTTKQQEDEPQTPPRKQQKTNDRIASTPLAGNISSFPNTDITFMARDISCIIPPTSQQHTEE